MNVQWVSFLRQGYIDVASVRYGLSHLVASVFTLVIPASERFAASTAFVHVEYTSHCVSVGQAAQGGLEMDADGMNCGILDHRNVARKFCADRYRWSLRLPAIVAQLGEKRCFFTGHSNWLVIEDFTDRGEPVEYEVFFRLRRLGANALRLVIESAYVRDPSRGSAGIPRNRRSVVRFRVMAAKILRGESVRDPQLIRR